MWNENSNGISTTNSDKVSFYLAPLAVLLGELRAWSAPTRMNMPGEGDEVNYDLKVVVVFHVTSLSNVIIVEYARSIRHNVGKISHTDKYQA